ncbi:hypothetical protein C8R46DRAFT_1349363 [Mycena filopes]|nr:hypothetical protein C8R46DRAFT_1349363 [Mycena filopes]
MTLELARLRSTNPPLTTHTMSPSPPSPARILILLTRKAGMTKAEFNRYWAEVHAPLVASLDIVKANAGKYEQGYTSDEMSDGLKAMGFKVLEYDGVVVLGADSHQELNQILQSEEFQKVVLGDAVNFVEDVQFIPLQADTV